MQRGSTVQRLQGMKPVSHRLHETRAIAWAAALAALCFSALAATAHSACRPERFTIALDVGHTADQPGALSARGVPEFAFNMALAKTVAAALFDQGFIVKPIVIPGGTKNQLEARVRRANAMAPDLFLSIHHDSVQPHYLERWTAGGRELSYSDRFSGFSLFVSKANRKHDESLRFARRIADGLIEAGLTFSTHHAEKIKGENRRLLDDARGIHEFTNLRVLRATTAPAVLLEAGIIVNRQDEVQLASPERRTMVAEAVTEAAKAMCADKAAPGLALR